MATYDDLIKSLEGKVENVQPASAMAAVATPVNPSATAVPKHADINPFAQENKGFYSTIYEQLFKNDAPETPEERSKREKRERSRANILALSDGLSSIANIWATTKGATPMDLTSLSDVNRKRYDYADKLRRENTNSWKRGVFQARMADMNARQQKEAMAAKNAQWKEEQAYKRDKDARDYGLKVFETNAKQTQRVQDNNLKKEQFEETKRRNKAIEGIAQANAATNRQRVEQSGKGKNDYYSIVGSDNKPIRVRKEAWKSYTGDIAQRIIEASQGDKTITSLINAQFNLNPQATLETIVNRYLHKFPEIEEYAKERAAEIESAYTGIHPASNETDPNYNISGVDWSELLEIPNL